MTSVWPREVYAKRLHPNQENASLRIEAGSAIDPWTGDLVRLELPYGEKPRLVLIHLATEAGRAGSLVVDVEESMTAFARLLGWRPTASNFEP